MKEGMVIEPACRDWRGWRLFTQAQVDRLKARTNQTVETRQFIITTDFSPEGYHGQQIPDLKVHINQKEVRNA